MHSSRMLTGCMPYAGVCFLGGCKKNNAKKLGGVWSRGVSGPGSCLVWGVWSGGVCSGGWVSGVGLSGPGGGSSLGGVVWGVSAQGSMCLVRGCLVQEGSGGGGICSGGCLLWGSVSAGGGCLLQGASGPGVCVCVCSRGVSAPGSGVSALGGGCLPQCIHPTPLTE